MYLEKSNSVIEYCVIRNNKAVMSGGGLYLENGNYKISNCVIDNNIGYPAGAYCLESIVQFYKVLLTNTKFDTMLLTSSSEIFIINCTITNNRSAFEIDHCDVNIINSIFWNDSPQINILRGDSDFPVSHVIIAYSNIKGGKNQIKGVNDSLYYENNNINSDPLFRNVENGDFSLNNNSPCINTGIASYTMRNMELKLKEEEYNGIAPDMGAFESDYSSTGVSEIDTSSMSLSNYPNPFNSTTTIHYSLSKPGHISLAIYSITGQKIIDLLEKTLPVGNYQAQWNGKDKSGINVSSGVYIIRLKTGVNSISKRVVFMK